MLSRLVESHRVVGGRVDGGECSPARGRRAVERRIECRPRSAATLSAGVLGPDCGRAGRASERGGRSCRGDGGHPRDGARGGTAVVVERRAARCGLGSRRRVEDALGARWTRARVARASRRQDGNDARRPGAPRRTSRGGDPHRRWLVCNGRRRGVARPPQHRPPSYPVPPLGQAGYTRRRRALPPIVRRRWSAPSTPLSFLAMGTTISRRPPFLRVTEQPSRPWWRSAIATSATTTNVSTRRSPSATT